jgi:tellurite resistance protein
MSSKKSKWLLTGLLAAGLISASALCARAEDKDKDDDKDKTESVITLDQVPAPVKDTIIAESKGGKIGEVEKEVEKGKTTYEADFTIGDKKYELKVAEDGTLLKKKLEDKDEEKDEKDEKK